MTRKDVMSKFNQIGGSFEYIKIELINGSSIFFHNNDMIRFREKSFTIYNECYNIQICYHHIRNITN